MRLPVVLVCVMLATAPVRAQPADAALVERVLDAVRLGRILLPTRAQLSGVDWILNRSIAYYYDTHIRIDSGVRNAMRPFINAVPADDLRAALTFLEGPIYDVWTLSEYPVYQYEDPIILYESWADVPLADSALTERLLAGLDASGLTEQMIRRWTNEVFASIPVFRAEAEADGMTYAEFVAQQFQNPLDNEDGHVLLRLRADLVDLPETDLRRLVAFYESDAGGAVHHAFNAALVDAVIPLDVEVMAGVSALRGLSGSEVVPPAEVFPEPVGGYDALAARVRARATNVDDVVRGGLVLVEVTVEKDGTPKDPRTRSGSDLALTRVLVEEVLRTRFVPGQTAGRAVRAPRAIAVRFPDRGGDRQDKVPTITIDIDALLRDSDPPPPPRSLP